VGDGILTYFGWPSAHEEDPERAVRVALEIVHTAKRASSAEDLSVRAFQLAVETDRPALLIRRA
jgi:hypothetical protein